MRQREEDPVFKRERDMAYKTVQGDTWDMIAKKVYGDEKKLDYLMENNPEKLCYFVFPEGLILVTPEIPEEDSSVLPEWRKR